MAAKKRVNSRKRSRPVEKRSKFTKIKKNKILMPFLILSIVLILVVSVIVIFNPLNQEDTNNTQTSSYENDPDYIAALAETDYPVAVLETSKGAIAIELYNDIAPNTCQNFIDLVNQNFYNGMIFHRIMDDFMIQAGRAFPGGSNKESPYGNIAAFEGDGIHVDGAISMASTGAGLPGSAEFFIMDGARVGPEKYMDGNYAAFGKTIYGIEVVRDIADDPHDSSFEPQPGGGKPISDIIINKIKIEKQ